MRLLFLFIISICYFNQIAQQLEWLDSVQLGKRTYGNGVSCDANGAIYVGGALNSNSPSGDGSSNSNGVYLRKYSATGNLIWQNISFAVAWTACAGIAIDNSGNTYLTVYLHGENNSIKFGNSEYPGGWVSYLVKYSPTGEIFWVRKLPNYASPWVVITDDLGCIYLSGGWVGGGFIFKYDGSGNLILTISLAKPGRISLDGSGNIYLVVEESLSKYGTTGNLLWTVNKGGMPAVDASGNVYLIRFAFYGKALLSKHNSSGQLQWEISTSHSAEYNTGFCITTDRNGNVYVAAPSNDFAISKYTPSGVESWTLKLPYYFTPTSLKVLEENIYLSCTNIIPQLKGYLFKFSMPATPLSVSENLNLNNFLVTPNPSDAVFSVFYKSDASTTINLQVIDMNGKQVINRACNFKGEMNESIDLNGCARGVYILELTGDKLKETRKLVVE